MRFRTDIRTHRRGLVTRHETFILHLITTIVNDSLGLLLSECNLITIHSV